MMKVFHISYYMYIYYNLKFETLTFTYKLLITYIISHKLINYSLHILFHIN